MKTEVLSVRITPDELRRLREANYDLRMPVGQIVRTAVQQYLDREYKKLEKKKAR